MCGQHGGNACLIDGALMCAPANLCWAHLYSSAKQENHRKIMQLQRAKDDRRKFPRYSVDWNASIKMGEKEIYHDRIYDLSAGGAGIYADKNILTGEPLVMLIDTPLPHFRQKRVVTRIECSMCHAVLSSNNSVFHIGIKFLRFQGIERHLLSEALLNRPALPTRRIN